MKVEVENVAPPRGERGLKCPKSLCTTITTVSRSPSWGAWIEIAPIAGVGCAQAESLPLVGSVD